MEPRGCNRWQPVANPTASEPQKHAKTVAMRCDQSRSGSSASPTSCT
jgi:hypothetical protein